MEIKVLLGVILSSAFLFYLYYMYAFQKKQRERFVSAFEKLLDKFEPDKGVGSSRRTILKPFSYGEIVTVNNPLLFHLAAAFFPSAENVGLTVNQRKIEVRINGKYYGRGMYYYTNSFFIPLTVTTPVLRIARKKHMGFRLKESAFSLENSSLEDLGVWADEPEKAKKLLDKGIQTDLFDLRLNTGEWILLDSDGLTLNLNRLVMDADELEHILDNLTKIADSLEKSNKR